MVGVFLLAAAGQAVLERARTHGTPPSLFAAVAFAAAAALAIFSLRKGDFLPGPPRPLEVPRHPPALYAACLPGGICLALALLLYGRASDGDPRPAALWLLGLGLLLLPGLWTWFRRPSRPTPGERNARRRLTAAALFLFAVAFTIRVWGGIDRIPGFLDSDESSTGIAGTGDFRGRARNAVRFLGDGKSQPDALRLPAGGATLRRRVARAQAGFGSAGISHGRPPLRLRPPAGRRTRSFPGGAAPGRQPRLRPLLPGRTDLHRYAVLREPRACAPPPGAHRRFFPRSDRCRNCARPREPQRTFRARSCRPSWPSRSSDGR